ncbi:MAG: alpha/beta hydrolase [bacterium]|nr:alpha/beta hydrolase [bacterium]
MSKNTGKKKGKVMWGVIYVVTFLVFFLGSAIIKLTYNPVAINIDWNDSIGKSYTDISYGEKEQNKFDLYVPADTGKQTYGLVVYLHAGGFTTGDKSDDVSMLQYFTSKGYVAAGINYTLQDDNNPEASVYTMSQEIKNSIPVVVEEAKKLGYEIDGIAMSGGSAGGCLALLYAYRDAETAPVPVKCVIEAVGPSSFEPDDWYGLGENPEAAAGLFSIMSGNVIIADMIGTSAYQDAIKDISPYMWVNETTVPTLMAYGKQDKICPFGTVKYLINALDENHVTYDYIEFSHSGHGLQNDNKQYKQYLEKMDEYLARYLGA